MDNIKPYLTDLTSEEIAQFDDSDIVVLSSSTFDQCSQLSGGIAETSARMSDDVSSRLAATSDALTESTKAFVYNSTPTEDLDSLHKSVADNAERIHKELTSRLNAI